MDLLYTVIDWVKAGWAWLGWGNLEANILLLGIDNAGKTTLLHFLKTGMLKQNLPTRKPTMEELQMDNILFRAYDLGGR
jgi:GTP-binding protein SAR1